MFKRFVSLLIICFLFSTHVFITTSLAQDSLKWPVEGASENSVIKIFSNGHFGVDIAAAEGTAVVAPDSGTVYWTYSGGSHGISAGIETAGGLRMTFLHMSERLVKKNQTIEAGQVIGKVGMTGTGRDSEAAHLHFGIVKNSAASVADPDARYIDPMTLLVPLVAENPEETVEPAETPVTVGAPAMQETNPAPVQGETLSEQQNESVTKQSLAGDLSVTVPESGLVVSEQLSEQASETASGLEPGSLTENQIQPELPVVQNAESNVILPFDTPSSAIPLNIASKYNAKSNHSHRKNSQTGQTSELLGSMKHTVRSNIKFKAKEITVPDFQAGKTTQSVENNQVGILMNRDLKAASLLLLALVCVCYYLFDQHLKQLDLFTQDCFWESKPL